MTREYEQVITISQGYETVLRKYHIEWAFPPTLYNPAHALSDVGWKTLYTGETAVILKNNTIL